MSIERGIWVDGLALGSPIVKWCPLVQQGRVRLLDWAASSRRQGGLNRPKCARRAFVHAEDFAYARVKHLNDVGSITGANALELFLCLFADQLASTKKFM